MLPLEVLARGQVQSVQKAIQFILLTASQDEFTCACLCVFVPKGYKMLEGRSKANGTFLELDFLPLFGLGSTKSDVHFGF